MTPSRGSVSAPSGFSLGAKFVGLTAGLILLLSVTALISLRNAAQTVTEIRAVVEFAIPAYGALARSHIRSLEQAVELRRALLRAEDPTIPDDAITDRIDAFLAARVEFRRQLEDAKRLLQEERSNTSSASAISDLLKLREGLAGLQTLTEAYDKETDACLAAIRARSLAEARQRLVTINGLRSQLADQLESARTGMFAMLNTISAEAQAAQARTQTATIVVFVLSSILGLSVAAIGAVRLIRSIRSIVHGAEAVEGGNLDTQIEITSRDEIGRLATSFNRMTEGLRMRDRIRDTFGKYVDRRIAEQLIGSGNLLAEHGDRREVAVLFCDLAGFTALSERVRPERLVQFLNAHFSLLAREIAATDGIIDKYIGDAVMAYWCPPFVPKEEVALRSADAALRCLGQMPAIAAAGRDICAVPIDNLRIRIGIASGQSITGSIGAQERRNYTVIGDTVNLASRIEGTNRLYRTTNLVCSRTAASIGAKFELREVDTVLLPGIEGPQPIFEIIGRAGQVSSEKQTLRAAYALALSAYRRGDWASARRHFSECLGISPDDGPTRTMLERIEALAGGSATAGTWSGVWPLKKDDLP
jgi:class 3 adenylate cyclase